MKHILLSIFLLLSGSVWGQATWKKADPNAFIWDSTAYTNYTTWSNTGHRVLKADAMEYIRDLIRAEIERWWDEKNKPDTVHSLLPYMNNISCREDILHKCQSEPLKMVIDTVWVDTVGWRMKEVVYISSDIYYDDLMSRIPPYTDTTDWKDIILEPVIKYTTRILYDLTPEQVERLR